MNLQTGIGAASIAAIVLPEPTSTMGGLVVLAVLIVASALGGIAL